MYAELRSGSHAKIQSYGKTKNNFLTGHNESHSALSLNGKKREKIKTPENKTKLRFIRVRQLSSGGLSGIR